jgi:hypothetical protein
LLASVSAAPVSACPLTTDSFTYADGEVLDGQDGGSDTSNGAFFTTPWEVDTSTPTAGFYIDNGKVTVGDTEGDQYRIDRGLDVTDVTGLGCPPVEQDPGCNSSTIGVSGTYFVAAELTQVEDNHAAYELGVEFSDAQGLTMAFGIENNGIDEDLGGGVFDHSDYFFATLGDSRLVSTVASLPGTPYYIIAALRVDVSAGGQEHLLVWINGDFNDVLNEVNADIEILLDLESVAGTTGDRDSIGDTVTLAALTNEPGMEKTFDDLQIFRDIEFLQVPRLDLGSGNIQSGFEEWTVGVSSSQDFELQFQQDEYMPSIDPTLVTLTIEAIDSAQNVTSFDSEPGTAGVADDLRRDGVGADGGVRLIFSGLHQDQYFVKTFHYQNGDNSQVDVYISEDGGTSFSFFNSFTPAGGTDRAREIAVHFETVFNNGDDIWVEFRPTVSGANVSLNGLQFVPEPSTGLLLALGLMGLGTARRRARQ